MADIITGSKSSQQNAYQLSCNGYLTALALHTSKCGFDKIAAIVVTDLPDKTRPFSPPDDVSRKISENIIAFLSRRWPPAD